MRLYLVTGICLTLLTTSAFAESPVPTVPADGTVSTEQIEAAIKAVEVRDGLDDEARSTVIDLLRDAQAQLKNAASADAAAEAFAAALETAPAETERLRTDLDREITPAPTAEDFGINEDTPLAEVEQLLARESADLASTETQLSDAEANVRAQEERPNVARSRINELRVVLDQLTSLVAADPAPGEQAILTDARLLNAELKLDARKAELDRLDKELLSHNVRLELIRAERDLAAREAIEARQRVEFLQSLVNNMRQASVEQAQLEAAEAEIAAAGKHPAVRAVAEGNAALTAELPAVAADIERLTRELAEVEEQAQQIEQSMTRSQQRLDVGGVNQVIGRFLVEERRNLPNVSQYRSDVRERRKVLSTIGLAQVRIEEQRRDITPIETFIEGTMLDVAADVTDEIELDVIRGELRELLRNRRDLLAQAASTYTSYLRALGDLDVAQRRLLEAADEYRVFLDQNLIWIPSTTIINLDTLENLVDAVAWLLSPRSWADTVAALFDSLSTHRVLTGLALLLIGGLISSRRALTSRYKDIDERLGRLSTDHIGLTFQAIGLSALRALPLPLALWFAGWALEHGPTTTEFTATTALTLKVTGPFLYNLMLFRELCAPDGVARRHFGWKKHNLDIIRRQLDRLILIGTPVLAVTVLAYASPYPEYQESLGRVAFVAFMLLFAFVIKPIGDPRNSVAATYYDKKPDTWVSRFKWVWFALEAGGPILLAVLALVGYLYTAAILTGRFIDTIWLVLAIIVANLVVLRWLALSRRKIEFKLALEKRESRRAQKEKAAEEGEHDEDGDLPVIEPKPLDIDAVDQQTRRLLQTGLFFLGVLGAWGIWSDVLPALNILDEISLWNQTVTVDGVDTLSPVTLADVLLALLIAAITWVASTNLPGLMEIAVLRRLDLEPGSRYTINTLMRYAVVTIGVISVFSILGWNWSRIQWLVAALSVGLGFGLQEIVANFVSGLIILFERPVRVGDTVTVGNLSGTVTKVRIRATTITDWDRKEIIVPNKAFITEQVVNWTLSDPITRVVIPVGISYGSDVQLAHRVMQETLHSMPLVLDEPPPRVYFMGFGDSSLDFNLYVYSRELSDRLPLMHAVHEEVFEAFRKNGIEIPFPQRDLHVRSVDDGTEFRVTGDAPDKD